MHKIEEIKWLWREDIVGRKIRKIIVSDEGWHGEFYLGHIHVQMDDGLWFLLGNCEPYDEAPLPVIRGDEIRSMKKQPWEESDRCLNQTICEIVEGNWPEPGLILSDRVLIHSDSDFPVPVLNPKLRALSEVDLSEVETYWGHQPVTGIES